MEKPLNRLPLKWIFTTLVKVFTKLDNAGLSDVGWQVPVPAAVWLFGSGLLGLVTVARRCV